VDTGVPGSAEAILAAVAAIGRDAGDVKEIVLTHYHDDHRGSASDLAERTGARVIAHRAEAPVIRGDQPQIPPSLAEYERPIAEGVLARMLPPDSELHPESAELDTLARLLVRSTLPPVRVNRKVEDGDTVAGGGTVLHIPGHTPGSLALHVPDLKVVFTGDTVASFEGRVIPGVFNVDRAEMMRSIRRLAALDVDVACFGHGAPAIGEAGRQIRALIEPGDALRQD
jgi:glyoxylase-like metal-dependent hydrolase (beta-lactamase superfamily II)